MQIFYISDTIRRNMFRHEQLIGIGENPITDLRKSTGWKEIKIIECGEPLVELNNLYPELISVEPQYFNQKISTAMPTMYARESVAGALIRAARYLPKNLKILVWDAWRSLEVQQSLFEEFKKVLHNEHLDWDEEKLIEATQTYVSLPSYNQNRPSPHNTGGAVDLTICDLDNNPLQMGVPFDYFGNEASTDFYEEIVSCNHDQIMYRNNRRLLYNVMTKSGFSNYNEEFWHYDLGNQFDAVRKNTIAIYGAIALK